MKRRSRPCADCPFREDSRTAEDRALLAEHDIRDRLPELVCHKTMMAEIEGEYDAERLCAGAQIVAGLMSPIGRPRCSLP